MRSSTLARVLAMISGKLSHLHSNESMVGEMAALSYDRVRAEKSNCCASRGSTLAASCGFATR